MSTLAGQSIITGNRIYIMARNQLIARAQSITGEQQLGANYVREIGNYMPVEVVYEQYTGTLTLNRFRKIDADLADMDITALGEDILSLSVLDINVMDKVTSSLIVSYRGCSASDNTLTIDLNTPSTEQIQFYYLYAANANSK